MSQITIKTSNFNVINK